MFGVVQRYDLDNFDVIVQGKVTGLNSLSIGKVYFLSPDSAGSATIIEPTGIGQISKPVYLSTSSTTSNILNYRGIIIS